MVVEFGCYGVVRAHHSVALLGTHDLPDIANYSVLEIGLAFEGIDHLPPGEAEEEVDSTWPEFVLYVCRVRL